MSLTTIAKNVLPAVAIFCIGVVGAYFVYENTFSDQVAATLSQNTSSTEPAFIAQNAAMIAEQAASIEPAAGIAEETSASSIFSPVEMTEGVLMDGRMFPPYPDTEALINEPLETTEPVTVTE